MTGGGRKRRGKAGATSVAKAKGRGRAKGKRGVEAGTPTPARRPEPDDILSQLEEIDIEMADKHVDLDGPTTPAGTAQYLCGPGRGFCAEQDAVMDSKRLALRRARVFRAESDRFVRSGGRECPKCGGARCGFVRGLATGETEPWSWGPGDGGEALATMCCADCLSLWEAVYQARDGGDAACPACARPSDRGRDGTFLFRDELLSGARCGGCGAKWYERRPLARAEDESEYEDDGEGGGLDDPDVAWTLGCGQTV